MDITGFIRRHPLMVYFSITFVFSWACWSGLVISTPPGDMQEGISPTFLLLAFLGGFGPTLSALIVTRAIGQKGSLLNQLRKWRVSIRWYVFALFIVPIISITTLYIAGALGVPAPTLSDMYGHLPLALIWPIFSSLGEELGWRGFLLPRLQSRHSALFSSIIVGVSAGIWHLLPDFIGIRHYGWMFVPIFILVGPVLLSAVAVIMTWIYNSTNSSLFLMVLFHYSHTFSAIMFTSLGLSPMESLKNALISAGIYWLIAAIIILIYGVKRLVREPKKIVV